MKKIIVTLMLVGASVYGCGMSPKHVVNFHLKAIKEGDLQLLEKLWVKTGAQIIEIKNGVLLSKDVDKTFRLWTSSKNPDLNAKVLSVTNVTDEIAVAKVSLTWQGSTYVEMLTLVKVDFKWEIIGKTYTAPKNPESLYGSSP